METQCLKKLIRGANKRVADGGEELIAQAESAGWAGEADEIIKILKKHRHLFGEDFDAQLPSLEQHLSTRGEDNLKATSEVIHQRLVFLQKEYKKEQESAKGVTETELNAPIGGSAEDDFASLLDQKSVDEMSESEMDALTLSGGSSAEQIISEPEVSAESEGDEAEEQVDLDTLLKEAKKESAPRAPLQKDAAPVNDDDFASLLEQKSVDEMSEEEMETLRPKDELKVAPPETKETSDDLDSLLSEGEPKSASDDLDSLLADEAPKSASDDLDSLLADEAPKSASDDLDSLLSEGEPKSASDDLDSLLSEGEPKSASDDLDSLLSEGEPKSASDDLDSLLSEGEPKSARDDLDSLLSEGEPKSASDDLDSLLSEGESKSANDDLDSLLSEGEPKSASDVLDSLLSDEAESAEPSESEMLLNDPNLKVSDVLDDILAEVGLDNEDSEAEEHSESLLEPSSEDIESEAQQEATSMNSEDQDLDSLLNEVTNEDSEESDLLASMSAASSSSEDIDDLLKESNDEHFDMDAESDNTKSLLNMLDTNSFGSTTQMLNTLEKETSIDSSDSEVDEILAEVDSDLCETTDVLEVLDALAEESEQAEESEENLDEEMLSDLLSEATGRQISMDDLESDDHEASVTLSELVHKADESFNESDSEMLQEATEHALPKLSNSKSREESGSESVRILAETFRLEKSGVVIYSGTDEKQVKALIAENIFSGLSSELKLVKICRKEIVKIVSEELPILVSIKA